MLDRAGCIAAHTFDEVGAQPTATEEVLSTTYGGDWEFRGQRRPHSTERSALPYPRVHPRFES